MYKPNMESLLCGGLNVNYLIDQNCQLQLSALLQTYNIGSHSADFPTRIRKYS